MRALVTGATGFTGYNLARHLRELGHSVRVLIRNKRRIEAFNGHEFDVVEGDIRKQDAVETGTRDIDWVFHIAAVYRDSGIKDQVYWDTHVGGTENLLKAAEASGVKRFVHCSTVGVHGHIARPPASEEYPFNPGDIYQLTKLQGERLALEFHRSRGLAVTVVRPTAIYGPGDLRLLKLFRMADRKIAFILGDGQIYYHMVFIADLVQGFLLAAGSPRAVGEVFSIGGPDVFTLNQIVDEIALHSEKKLRKLYLPAGPFQLLGLVCERICIPFGINPPIYPRRVDFFTKSRRFDITKARRILNYAPQVGMSQGLLRTAAWYRRQGLL
jgi:nucleoside-diphosphate-sugar epimerase